MTKNKFSLAIHGGAGASSPQLSIQHKIVLNSMKTILEEGRHILERGGIALDAVTRCVEMLENDPLYNAGHGAIHNKENEYELDAAIMDGKTLALGSIGAARNIRNPVHLARAVMERTEHVMIVGQGAVDFAKKQNIPIEADNYFKSAHEKVDQIIEESHGTVGAVAYDIHGNLAAATSTGGWTTKIPGRIGDTPIIGAGTFADNNSCAVSCTGCGEDFIRTTIAARMACAIEYKELSAQDAAEQGLADLIIKAKGYGGFILIDKNGNVACAQSSGLLRHGWIEHGGPVNVAMKASIINQTETMVES